MAYWHDRFFPTIGDLKKQIFNFTRLR